MHYIDGKGYKSKLRTLLSQFSVAPQQIKNNIVGLNAFPWYIACNSSLLTASAVSASSSTSLYVSPV